MRIDELNRWWAEKKVRAELAPLTRRELFSTVRNGLARRQIQIVTGLRRTGKSTILFQLISSLIKSGVDPLHILYCSFDDPELQEKRVEGILKEYSKLTNTDYKEANVYLFLDEAQKAAGWVASVKLIYDNLKNIKIVASGSASLSILSEAKKNLAGRALYYELKPLTFPEFLHIKGIEYDARRPLLYKDILEREFEKFLKRPFPELVNEEDATFINGYIRSAVIEPIILKDIPKEFKDVDILLLEKLVTIFLTQPGQYLQLDELAKELGRAKTTLYKAFFYLEFSFILRKILNYRPSIRAASRKLARIYPYHPCLTLPFNASEESYAESLVLFELGAKHYWREKGKEVDALIDGIPVEVKFKSKIGKDDLKWLEYFLKRYGKKLNTQKGYIITKDVEETVGNIALIPLWRFCLQGLDN